MPIPGEATTHGKDVETVGGFFRLIQLDAAAAGDHPDTWDRIRNGHLQGAIIHNIYDKRLINEVVGRLERHDPRFLKTWFPKPFRAWFYGRNLNLAAPDLAGYFEEAALFNAQIKSLFPENLGLEIRMAGLFSALDHGRPFMAAPGPATDQRYMFTTFRAHERDGYIAAHCDNEAALRPSYKHLFGIIEPHIYSCILTLAPGEDGGALEIFNKSYEPLGTQLMSDDHYRLDFNLADMPYARFRLPPGSAIILDAGRYLHRVSPVEGSQIRWTTCSFMALNREHDAMYCWG